MAVLVRAPARLHLGFIPPAGKWDSPGSAALAIENPKIEIHIRESDEVHVSGPYSDLIFDMVFSFIERFAPGKGAEIEVKECMKRHAGFGSGTRMAMSVGMGLSALFGLKKDPYEIAEFFGRGRNSKAGIETLLHGNIVLTRGEYVKIMHAPKDWRFLIALPEDWHSLYGEEERKAMDSVKHGEVGRSPGDEFERAISSGEIEEFGRVLEEIDLETGKLFSPIQKGTYSNEVASSLIRVGKEAGAYAAGQSSWGPAIYFLVDDRVEDDVKGALQSRMDGAVESSEIAREGIVIEALKE
jgi:beta-ribofuranosylaminobenzene 5'-phosphate synthase